MIFPPLTNTCVVPGGHLPLDNGGTKFGPEPIGAGAVGVGVVLGAQLFPLQSIGWLEMIFWNVLTMGVQSMLLIMSRAPAPTKMVTTIVMG